MDRWILQFCHGYDGPFMDCARQYAALFKDTEYKVCTVYLTGSPRDEVVAGSASDEVLFFNYSSKDIRGLKLAAIRQFRAVLATRNFTLCIAHRFKPIYIALLGSKLPIIGIHHAFGDYQRRSRRLFINHFRHRLILLGVSNAVRDNIRHSLPAWEESRIQTLYNRIDIAAVQAAQVSREAAREHLGLPQDAWIVGNVGRLHPDKDQATLIRAFSQALPKLPAGSLLVILGTGRLEDELKALANELGLHDSVRFLGQIPNARNYFKALDLFVLSSDHEPFGMVLLEAMAAGIPIIASNSGGAPEVIGDPQALFPLGDASGLADKLAAVCAAGQSTVDQHTLTHRLETLFSDQAIRQQFYSLPQIPLLFRP